MSTPSYPETRYAPVRPINLASKDERARLSPWALKGFFFALPIAGICATTTPNSCWVASVTAPITK